MKQVFTTFLFSFLLSIPLLNGQSIIEFPIAVGSDTTLALSAAFDGTNYFVPIQGDQSSQYNITAQFVSQSGNLVGTRISFGTEGGNPIVAFDGTNYLVIWNDNTTKLYGQFVSPSGSFVGPPFVIANEGWIGMGCIIYADTTYMAIYESNNTIITAQRISKSGNLIGNPITLSSSQGHLDGATAFDGNNILVGWRGTSSTNNVVFGQLISKTGTLVGSNIIIDDSQFPSDNPLSIAFDGTRYLVCFMDEVDIAQNIWNIYGRFVSTSGAVQERITISDMGNSNFPFIAFDGSNFFVTWNEIVNPANEWHIKGQYFNTAGTPIGSVLTLANPADNKVPLGGVLLFDGTKFLVGENKVVTEFTSDSNWVFTDGDVYGIFVPNSTTDVNENHSTPPNKYILYQNYPNPFNPSTFIKYTIPHINKVTIKVYNLFGKEVATLINEEKPSGTYEVNFNASQLSSGVYYYTIKAGNFRETRKMILLK